MYRGSVKESLFKWVLVRKFEWAEKSGYEALNMILKGQVKSITVNNAKAQKDFIENLFGLVV